jgi:hypothetical protein
MSPFLSFLATRAVAHFFRSRFVDEDVVDVLELGVGVLELVVRDELFVLLEPDEDEPLLDDRSSLRFSSPRRSSSFRELLPLQSLRPRSPNRPRSRLSPSDRELPLGGWAKVLCDVAGRPSIAAQANAANSSRCKRDFIVVSTLSAGRCFAATRFNAYCCHCSQMRPPLSGQPPNLQNQALHLIPSP